MLECEYFQIACEPKSTTFMEDAFGEEAPPKTSGMTCDFINKDFMKI